MTAMVAAQLGRMERSWLAARMDGGDKDGGDHGSRGEVAGGFAA